MKFNKFIKIFLTIMMIALMIVFASQTVFATSDPIDPLHDDISQTYKNTDKSGAANAAGNIIGMIINIAQVIGVGVAIIMLVVLAIQYIAASPEGKAEIKKNSTVYIVGTVILFAASGILGIIRRFAVKSIGGQDDLGDVPEN